jgi:hypothetical protein
VTDPERLLAEALRAQAAGTGQVALPTAGVPGQARPPSAGPTVPVRWILVLALLLGLAAGATIGLLTML